MLANLLENGSWERYARSGRVKATTQGETVELQSGDHVWMLPAHAFNICYTKVGEDLFEPVPHVIWACRVNAEGTIGGRQVSASDYAATWADDEGVDRARLRQAAGNPSSLDIWVIDGRIFPLRYTLLGEAGASGAPRAAPVADTAASDAVVAAPSAAVVGGGVPGLLSGAASLQGKRNENEDQHLVLPEWEEDWALFGVFDGHGGDLCSTFCAEKLPEFLSEVREELDSDPEATLQSVFVKLDKKYNKKGNDDGSTALIALLHKKTGSLRVANVGDSRGILVRGNGAVEQLSVDHKPSLPEEKARIEAMSFEVTVETLVQHGKRVKVPRVDGKLAISRAIGDDQFKDMDEPVENWAVTPVPQQWNGSLGAGEYVVLACDGLWDVCSNEQVAKWLLEQPDRNTNLTDVANRLAQWAIDQGSDDNVSCVILRA